MVKWLSFLIYVVSRELSRGRWRLWFMLLGGMAQISGLIEADFILH